VATETIEEAFQEDIDYYQNLTPADRRLVDRIIGIYMVKEQYQGNNKLRQQDDQYFSNLDKGEKDRINRLAKVFENTLKNNPNVYMLDDDQSYYQIMPIQKRSKINRLIVQRSFGRNNEIEFNNQEKLYLRKLSDAETARLRRILVLRKANERLFGEDLERDYQALNLEDVVASIKTFKTGDYKNVTVTGKLIYLKSGEAAKEIEIPLVDENNQVIKITTTAYDGSFRYSNLPANSNFRILAEGGTRRVSDVDKYFIKDLKIEGSQKIVGAIKYENIYFDFNSDAIRQEAKIILSELVTLSQKYPEMQVEVNGYTDHVGSDNYNLKLSKRRAKAAFDYLVARGVPRTSLVINGKGKATSYETDAYFMQLNRRVELEIFGGGIDYVSQYTTYIVKPQTTLFSIAEAFDMSVEELVSINGLKSNSIEAYSPIRVRKTDKSIDNTLVFVDSGSEKGYRRYTVKQGEDIISLAEKFNIPEELLMEINGLTNPRLKPGQILNILIH